MNAFLSPGYVQIIERKANGWFQTKDEVLNLSDRSFDWLNKEKYFGLTKQRILTELFRRYQGKLGFYLVHLAKQEYYYCGLTLDKVQQQLWELGITQPDTIGESHG